MLVFLLSIHVFAAETGDYSDYRRSAPRPTVSRRPPQPVQKQPIQRRKRAQPTHLESYENDPDLKEIEVAESDDPTVGPSLKYSQTHIFLGPALLRGNWSANPSNTAMAYFGLGHLIYKNPIYLNLNVTSLVSPTTPRNFMISANIGGGLLFGSQHVLPFLGFEAGAARMVVAGKGNGFGFKLTPELGFFPLKIKDHPVYMKVQYNWMALRIADRIPSWYSLLIGIAF